MPPVDIISFVVPSIVGAEPGRDGVTRTAEWLVARLVPFGSTTRFIVSRLKRHCPKKIKMCPEVGLAGCVYKKLTNRNVEGHVPQSAARWSS